MRRLAEELRNLEEQSLYRRLPEAFKGVDFSSNDYLGLSNNPEIRRILIKALENGCPLGSTGSRLLSGQSRFHEQAETFLASTYKVDSALLFNSGYSANMSVLSALNHDETEFFSDALNHASIIDGMRVARAKKTIFRHNDMNHLEELLRQSRTKRKVIVTESVFSMDGDLAPLSEISSLSQTHSAILVVDEAHATGIFGDRGLGRLESLGHQNQNLISIHTCGKALGAQGAFVLSTGLFREALINKARPFIFSTSLSPLSAIHLETAVRHVVDHPGLGQSLLQRAHDLRAQVKSFCSVGGASQIVPIQIGSAHKAIAISKNLLGHGFNVRPIRFPTVARGTERLRIALNITHEPRTIHRLASALQEAMTEC